MVSASTNHSLVFEWWDCVHDVESNIPWCKVKDVTKIEAHPMQFTVWRFSPKSRTIVDLLVTVIFAIIVHMYVAWVMDSFEARLDDAYKLFDMEAALNEIEDKTSTEYVIESDLVFAYQDSI